MLVESCNQSYKVYATGRHIGHDFVMGFTLQVLLQEVFEKIICH